MKTSNLEMEMRSWRRHLHRNPEFGFEEHKTSKFVQEKLLQFGFDNVKMGIGKTGVVGTLSRGKDGGKIALRADMDCLRIHETTNLSYTSSVPGLMHACGHDGHTAILLGAAALLASEGGFEGTVHFVFQPAEEWGQGMKAMINDGLGADIRFDEIYGLHNMPGLPLGEFEIRSGQFMGAEDGFNIVIRGIGGHASRPHECKDAIVCACSIVNELQKVVSRIIDPAHLAVVSVTSITGNNIKNVISSEARIEGDCRYFDQEISQVIEKNIRRIANGVAMTHGCEVDVIYERVFIPLVNHPDATRYCLEVAEKVFGVDRVNGNAARMGASEDFARALEIVPGAFGNIGNGDSAPLHSSKYDFNDDALIHGVRWFTELVRTRLPIAS